jgi:hypothetical protein
MKVEIQAKNGDTKVVDLNRRKAIHERCLNCVGWFPSEIQTCELTSCPLYPYRFGNGKQDAKARRKAIRKYCLWCSGGKPSEVTECPISDCPLYAFRKQRLDRSVEIDLAIENHHIGHLFEASEADNMVNDDEKIHF